MQITNIFKNTGMMTLVFSSERLEDYLTTLRRLYNLVYLLLELSLGKNKVKSTDLNISPTKATNKTTRNLNKTSPGQSHSPEGKEFVTKSFYMKTFM